MTTEEKRETKCSKCRIYRFPSQFIKDFRVLKTCEPCRDADVVYRQNRKCEHGRRKEHCSEGECYGSQICIHEKRKSQCKQCKTLGQICIIFKPIPKS